MWGQGRVWWGCEEMRRVDGVWELGVLGLFCVRIWGWDLAFWWLGFWDRVMMVLGEQELMTYLDHGAK